MAKKENILEDTHVFELEVGYKDEDGVIHKEVEIREIIGADEEAIAKAEVRQNMGKVITTLLANVVVRIGDLTPKTYGKSKWEKIFRELPMGDRDKLMFEIRKFTQGNEIELDMKCPNCNSNIKHIVDMDEDIEHRPLEVDPFAIPFELPRGIRNKDGQLCKKGILRLPNGVDQEQLDSLIRKNPGVANTTLLTRTIVNIDDYGQATMSTLRKMTTRDRDYLLKLLGDSAYGPKFEVEFPCPVCSEDIEAGVNPINFI